jgi:hypothetical protein
MAADPNRCPGCGDEPSANDPAGVCPHGLRRQTTGGELPGLVDGNATIVSDDADSAGSLAPGWSETVDSDSTGTWQEAVTHLPDATAVRDFGDCELPTELGRGGLGVVSKAWRVSLNQPVALKMIKAGTPADDAALRRFPNEAEAVAPSPGETIGGGPAGPDRHEARGMRVLRVFLGPLPRWGSGPGGPRRGVRSPELEGEQPIPPGHLSGAR